MANAVYQRSHQGLSGMISALAAHRVLTIALARRGMGPDSVDATSMAELLTGPVYATLGAVLPKEGLQRQLHALAASVRASSEPNPQAKPAAPGAKGRGNARSKRGRAGARGRGSNRYDPGSEGDSQTASEANSDAAGAGALGDVTGRYREAARYADTADDRYHDRYDNDSDEPEDSYDEEAFWRIGREEARADAPDPLVPGEPPVPQLPVSQLPVSQPAAPQPPAPDSAQEAPAEGDGETRAAVLERRFAALEHVVCVAVFGLGDEAQEASEGGGCEALGAVALRALALGGRALLERHGRLRRYHLRHADAQVLVLANQTLTLALVARPAFDPATALQLWDALEEAP